MKRNVIAVVIVAFSVIFFSTIIIMTRAKPEASPPAGKKAAPVEAAVIPSAVTPDANADIVYYFMTSQRCPSCMKIEAYTKEAVARTFADALKKGGVVWRMVNVDRPENNHFVKDYQLYTKSVVLVRIRGGKQTGWKNLDKIWTLLSDKAAFQSYVVKEMKAFLGEKG